jgi:hypothetical protein
MEIPKAVHEEFLSLPPHYYGSIEITLQDGLPVLIKTTATKKIHTERNNRYGNDKPLR